MVCEEKEVTMTNRCGGNLFAAAAVVVVVVVAAAAVEPS